MSNPNPTSPNDPPPPPGIWQFDIGPDGHAYIEGSSDVTDQRSTDGAPYGWFCIEASVDEARTHLAELGFTPEQIAEAEAA